MNDPRLFPLRDVSRAELERLADGAIASVQRLGAGLTNTLHRVTLVAGGVLVVKHIAGGARPYRDELAALTKLAGGTLPVPEVLRFDAHGHAIVYRWIEGVTLNECRKREPPAAFASLADPLGRLFARLGRSEPLEGCACRELAAGLTQARIQLADGRPRARMGASLAEALTHAYAGADDRLAWGRQCVSHGDLGGRNILVQRADEKSWRIGGVIDWESVATGSPLVDIGSLFRYAGRYDATFRAAFERGYGEADGVLPDDWYRTARLLDAIRMIDTLDEVRELPGVFADCRILLARLVEDLAAGGA